MKKKKILIGAGIVVAVGVGFATLAMRGRGDQSIQVQTAKVSRQKIVQKVNGTGKIQPKTQVKISATLARRLPLAGRRAGRRGSFSN